MPAITTLLQTSRSAVLPIIGDGVTLGIGSDCYPATIIAIDYKRGRITVQRDIATPGPNYDYYRNQEYTYTPDPNGATETWSLRKNGRFALVGTNNKSGGYLSLNGRKYYQDPSF